jgi:hypothetical protein
MKVVFFTCNLLAAASVCLGDDIKSYSVPKEEPAAVATVPPATAPQAEVNPAPVHWTVPASWKEMPPTAIRIGNFLVPGRDGRKAEMAITSFPGPVGTELDNVNRWRREIGLPAISQGEISAEPVTVDSMAGKLYDLTGAAARTVVVSLPRDGNTWFFKLRGDTEVVGAAKPVFADFLKSVHFAAGEPVPLSAGIMDAAATPPGNGAMTPDPHAGLAMAAQETAGVEPKWATPKNWVGTAPGMMVLKSYSIAGDAGHHAGVTISTFPGDVGGTFANVNRWRRQMGLPPVAQDDLSTVTQPLEVGMGKAVVVDFTGKDAKTAQPARMVAVIVAQGDNTWFYKLTGDEPVVAREKPGFLSFVQNVRYP